MELQEELQEEAGFQTTAGSSLHNILQPALLLEIFGSSSECCNVRGAQVFVWLWGNR